MVDGVRSKTFGLFGVRDMFLSCIVVHTGVHVAMRVAMCIDMCVDMSKDMCMDGSNISTTVVYI